MKMKRLLSWYHTPYPVAQMHKDPTVIQRYCGGLALEDSEETEKSVEVAA
jgi:hypothetical protein